MVKWTLEHRADNPGIHDGDMFISNDPFIGATHQNDAALLCPVFVDGRIFCWVTNSMHQTDVGGTTPGSFCADAPDIFHEPTPIQPIKIVERGEVRSDIHDIYLRQSRAPHLLALDLRAGISGNNVSKQSVLALVDRYGADVVKGVMRRIIAHSEQVIRDRLERLPDGVFRDRRYVECALPGDRGLYELGFSIEKTGSRLSISNEGSAPQTGALNCSFGGWRSGIINALAIAFCTDLYYAIGGLIRCMDFGEVCRARSARRSTPHRSPTGPTRSSWSRSGRSATRLGRMMIRDETQRSKIFISAGMNGASVDGMHATAADGSMWASINFEMMSGAIGAFATKDGVPSGGLIFDLKGRAPDVETLELGAPVLYLYRREYADSAGVGRWARGTRSARRSSLTAPMRCSTTRLGSASASRPRPGCSAAFRPTRTRCAKCATPISTSSWAGARSRSILSTSTARCADCSRVRPGSARGRRTSTCSCRAAAPATATRCCESPSGCSRISRSATCRCRRRASSMVSCSPATRSMPRPRRRGGPNPRERLGGAPPNQISERDGVRLTETLIIDGDRIVCRMCGHGVGAAPGALQGRSDPPRPSGHRRRAADRRAVTLHRRRAAVS